MNNDNKKQNDLMIKFINLESIGFVEVFRNKKDIGNQFVKNYVAANAYLEFRIFSNEFFGIYGWLEFPEVESILEEVLLKNNFNISTQRWTLSIYDIIDKKEDEFWIKKHSDAQKIELVNEKNVNDVAIMILDVIENMYLPIFEKFSELNVVDEEIIRKRSHLEVANYINVHMPFKKLIVMKLCKNPEYDTYGEWLSSVLKERHDRGERPEYYRLFLDLQNRLESEY